MPWFTKTPRWGLLPVMRGRPYFRISPLALASGASATFTLETPDLTVVDWNKLHYVALVDYRPVSGSAYDMLQAAVALPTVSDNPADQKKLER